MKGKGTLVVADDVAANLALLTRGCFHDRTRTPRLAGFSALHLPEQGATNSGEQLDIT